MDRLNSFGFFFSFLSTSTGTLTALFYNTMCTRRNSIFVRRREFSNASFKPEIHFSCARKDIFFISTILFAATAARTMHEHEYAFNFKRTLRDL